MKNDLAVSMGRVSTARQGAQGLSLADQDLLFPQYAEKCGHTLVKSFSFNESAATSEKRKLFREVVAFVKHHDIGHFYIEDTERLTRDSMDIPVIKDLYEKESVTFHFIRDSYTLNKNLEGASKINFMLRLAFAEDMIDKLRKKMRAKMLYKVERGEWPMRPLYGYSMTEKRLTINDRTAPIVRRVFSMRQNGATLREIADALNRDKIPAPRGTEWHFQQVEKMLRQVGYIGKVKWKGVTYPAKHDPLINDDQFNIVQQSFTQSSRKNVKNAHLFSGMIRLASGRLFSPEVHKGHVYYAAYSTGRKRIWLSEAQIFDQVSPIISGLRWSDGFGDFVREAARDAVRFNKTEKDRKIHKTQKELSELRGKAARMYEDRLDGTISKDLYLSKAAENQARQAELERRLKGLLSDDRQFLAGIDQIIEDFQTLPVDYTQTDNFGKAVILKALCKGFIVDGDKQITPVYRETFGCFINPVIDDLKRARVRDSSIMRPLMDAFRTLAA